MKLAMTSSQQHLDVIWRLEINILNSNYKSTVLGIWEQIQVFRLSIQSPDPQKIFPMPIFSQHS